MNFQSIKNGHVRGVRFKGVYFINKSLWVSILNFNGKIVFVGAFSTLREAVIIRDTQLFYLGKSFWNQMNFRDELFKTVTYNIL